MKIAIRFCLIVAFIFSFFFFLSKPANAFSSSTATIQEAISVVSEVNSQMGLTPYCWYMTAPSEKTAVAIAIYYSNYLWTGWDSDLTMRCPMGRYNTTNNLMYNTTNSVLLVKLNPGEKWMATVNTTQHPSLTANYLQASDLLYGITVNFSYWSYTSRYLNSNYSITDQVFSYRPIFWSPNLGGSTFDCTPTNVLCNSMGFDSIDIPTGSTIFGGAPEYLAPAPPEPTYKYFIEYRDNFVSTSWLRLEFNGSAYISSSYAVGANLIGFTDSEWVLYETDGTQRALLDNSSSYYPPYLYIADVNFPCSSILRSNFGLRDDAGNIVCMATVNPVVDEIAKKFTGIVNYDTATDLGMFEPLEPVIAWVGQVVDDVALWFHGLWVNFLNLIIPMPDFLSFAFQEIKQVADEKFAQIDVSSLEDFGELDEDTLPNITTSLMGVSVTIVNFDLIKPHIVLLRTIMIATVGLFIILFNVNQVNKLLSDNPVTE